jgi:hypothetical protein
LGAWTRATQRTGQGLKVEQVHYETRYKGMISEVELMTMRSRLERGKLNKAERGELFVGAPLGYVRLPSGGLDSTPMSRSVAGSG